MGTIFTPPEGSSGCLGPHVYMPFSEAFDGWVDVDMYPLSACEEPMASVAAMSRLISGAVMLFLLVLGIVRRASATVSAQGVGS